jgi:hypothetical protein
MGLKAWLGHVQSHRDRNEGMGWWPIEYFRFTCPYRKSNPDVLMVQSAQDRQAENAANGLNTARNRRILAQR